MSISKFKGVAVVISFLSSCLALYTVKIPGETVRRAVDCGPRANDVYIYIYRYLQQQQQHGGSSQVLFKSRVILHGLV